MKQRPKQQLRNATHTPADGCSTAGIYPNLDLERQSGERQLIASEGAEREIAAEKS